MINQLNNILTPEEERLIEAITTLIQYACKGSKQLEDLEQEMVISMARLKELHPQYCIKKAEIIEAFVSTINGRDADDRH